MKAIDKVLLWYNKQKLEHKKLSKFKEVLSWYILEGEVGAPPGNSNACQPDVGEGSNCGGGGTRHQTKTAKEASDAASKLGVKSASYENLDINVVNESLDAIETVKNEFPSTINSLKEVTWARGGPPMGHAPDFDRLQIRTDYFGSPEATQKAISSYKKMEDTNMVTKGFGSLKGMLTHEMGHVISDNFNLKLDEDIRGIWNSYSMYPGFKNRMTTDLSKYAATNIEEFIAESWCEYNNTSNPRPLSQKVGEIIRNKYKGK